MHQVQVLALDADHFRAAHAGFPATVRMVGSSLERVAWMIQSSSWRGHCSSDRPRSVIAVEQSTVAGIVDRRPAHQLNRVRQLVEAPILRITV